MLPSLSLRPACPCTHKSTTKHVRLKRTTRRMGRRRRKEEGGGGGGGEGDRQGPTQGRTLCPRERAGQVWYIHGPRGVNRIYLFAAEEEENAEQTARVLYWSTRSASHITSLALPPNPPPPPPQPLSPPSHSPWLCLSGSVMPMLLHD